MLELDVDEKFYLAETKNCFISDASRPQNNFGGHSEDTDKLILAGNLSGGKWDKVLE